MKKIVFPILFSLTLAFSIMLHSNAQTLLSKNVIRLHVIANSDSEVDQAVKLKVRDAILDWYGQQRVHPDKEHAQTALKDSLSYAESIANRILNENGFSYTAHAEYGEYEFPTRTYRNITLPAGKYSGLRIRLGNSNGKNWWCVMYPPLCLNEASASASETTSPEIEFKIKFKFLEFFQSL